MDAFKKLHQELVNRFELSEIEETRTIEALSWWIYDAMGGNDPKDFFWWKEFNEWLSSPVEWKQKEAEAFLDELVVVFTEVLSRFYPDSSGERSLSQMVRTFDKQTRYGTNNYFEFFQALQHTLWVRVPVVCFIGGHASGDMFGIGASALLKSDMGIVVHEYKDKSQDHSRGMKQFFDLVAPGRANLADSAEDCFNSKSAKSVYALMEKMKTFCWLAGYNMGTYFLMDKFGTQEAEEKSRRIVRSGFKVDGHPDAKIKSFLELKTLPLDELKTRRVVVLWSRFTGKKGEYHPEHDTSFKGMAQLAWLAAELGYYVIITGDKPIVHQKVVDREKRKGKFQKICEAIKDRFGEARCFNLTEFWEDSEWTAFQPSRIMQYQLYELLHRECDVRHLGMRSGNLEALALLSYFVRYMEEEESWGGERMKVWHERGIGYERILLREPPTRVGRYLHHDQKLNTFGNNRDRVSKAFVPSYIRERNRGVERTSSSKLDTVDQQFVKSRQELKARFSQAPTANLNKQFDKLNALRVQEEGKQEKPPVVKQMENGFDPKDLEQMVQYFKETNACCRKKLVMNMQDIWGSVPDLQSIEQQLGDQAPIVLAMRGVLAKMGLVLSVSN